MEPTTVLDTLEPLTHQDTALSGVAIDTSSTAFVNSSDIKAFQVVSFKREKPSKPCVPVGEMVNSQIEQMKHRSYMGRGMRCSNPVIIVLALISLFVFIIFQMAGFVPRKPVPPSFAWAANASRNMTLYLRPSEPTALIQPYPFCQDPPFLLFVVLSAVKNTQERIAIRRSWGQWANTRVSGVSIDKIETSQDSKIPVSPFVHPTQLTRLIFLLGKSPGPVPLSESVLEESRLYEDMVIEDFIDSYTNLTLKTVFMLKWVHHNCPTVKFVMKVDDDIFVNALNLELSLLNETIARTPLLLGSLICGARPIHDQWSKWYTPKYMFREGKYPNYLSGTGYVVSGDIIEPLLKAALSTEYFHLEDVFLTGLCAKAIGVHAKDHIGFSYQPRAVSPCLYKEVIMGHKVAPPEMTRLWNMMNQPSRLAKCHSVQKSRLRSYGPTKCSWR